MKKSEKEKMISGELYNAFTAELIEDRKNAYKLLSKLNKMGKTTQNKRNEILKKLFGKHGKNLWIESPFFCDYGYEIFIGDNVFINFNCTFLDSSPITIGDNVLIGPNVQIFSATHPIDWKIRKEGLENSKPVTIGNNVWIGGGAVICPGVSIGDRTTIGAGSVVTKNISSDVVAAGNPCRIIKNI